MTTYAFFDAPPLSPASGASHGRRRLTLQSMPLTRRQRRTWAWARVGFQGLYAALWFAAIVPLPVWGRDSDAAAWGAVAFVCLSVQTIWLVLPVSALPSALLVLRHGSLYVPTYRRLADIDLTALRSLDARTLPSKGTPAHLLSLRDQRGGWAVLLWSSVPDEIRRAVCHATAQRSDVKVSPRARAMLELPDAPTLGQRIVLTLRTALVDLAFMAFLLVTMVRVWGGFWLWEA